MFKFALCEQHDMSDLTSRPFRTCKQNTQQDATFCQMYDPRRLRQYQIKKISFATKSIEHPPIFNFERKDVVPSSLHVKTY